MSWDLDTPAMIAQLRLQLCLCPTWLANGGAVDQVHFPSANPYGTNGSTPDPLPLAELESTSTDYTRYAEGGGGLEQGTLVANLLFPATGTAKMTAGQVEAAAKGIIAELFAQPTGIPFQSGAGFTRASEPSPGAIAADTTGKPCAFRSIKITLPYGLRP